MQITIDLPKDIEQQLTIRATQLNIPLPTLILQTLIQFLQNPNPDDTPKEEILEGIRQGLHEAFTGQTIPLSQMWEGIDGE